MSSFDSVVMGAVVTDAAELARPGNGVFLRRGA